LEGTGKLSVKDRIIVPTIALSRFTTQPTGIITSLLFIEIAQTYNCSIGVACQIRSASSIMMIVSSFIMGYLSTRYSFRNLLLIGLSIYVIASIGCFFAPTFGLLLVIFSLNGVAMGMVTPMTTSIIGASLPVEKRASAVGWIVGGIALSHVIGSPAINYINNWGWKYSFIGFILPIATLSIFLVFYSIPNIKTAETRTQGLLSGFTEVLKNKSASLCLLGTVLSFVSWGGALSYFASLYREKFGLTTSLVSIIIVCTSLSYLSGSILSGKFISRHGRKRVVTWSAFLCAVFGVLFWVTGIWTMVVFFSLISCFFSGLRASSSDSLTLEQIPQIRGTVMSLNTAAISIGSVIGTLSGGYLLTKFGYSTMGIVISIFGVLSAALYYYTIDPIQTDTN
jgi:predicted MFS family arabinose efflux permease